MQFTVNAGALQEELSLLQKIVERKNTIPILANVLLTAERQTLSIRGTDLDNTLITEVPATIKVEGSTAIPARKLFEAIKLLNPDDEVDFSLDSTKESRAKLQQGKAKFQLPTIDAKDFPAPPEMKLAKLKVAAEHLRQWIPRIRFAITTEEGRYTLGGAKFEIGLTDTKIIATDGHRLAYLCSTEMKARSGQEIDVLVPSRALDAVEAALGKAEEGAEVRIGADENHVFFQTGARIIVSRLLSGQFPNYERILPKSLAASIEIDTARFDLAIKRASLTADDRSWAVRVDVTTGAITVSSETEDGRSEDKIEVEYAGPDTTIGFNAKYLRDFLGAADTEKIVFGFNDGNSQAKFSLVGSLDCFCIIMPLRL